MLCWGTDRGGIWRHGGDAPHPGPPPLVEHPAGRLCAGGLIGYAGWRLPFRYLPCEPLPPYQFRPYRSSRLHNIRNFRNLATCACMTDLIAVAACSSYTTSRPRTTAVVPEEVSRRDTLSTPMWLHPCCSYHQHSTAKACSDALSWQAAVYANFPPSSSLQIPGSHSAAQAACLTSRCQPQRKCQIEILRQVRQALRHVSMCPGSDCCGRDERHRLPVRHHLGSPGGQLGGGSAAGRQGRGLRQRAAAGGRSLVPAPRAPPHPPASLCQPCEQPNPLVSCPCPTMPMFTASLCQPCEQLNPLISCPCPAMPMFTAVMTRVRIPFSSISLHAMRAMQTPLAPAPCAMLMFS